MSDSSDSNEAMRQLLRDYHTAWAQGDLQALEDTLHAEFVTYDVSSGDERDGEWEKQNCASWHAAFSDTAVTIQRMVVEDDFITVHWHLSATHTDDFMGISASDTPVSLAGIEINRIEDGRIRETWRLSDTMALMQQLDAL
jgi:predicted ester cyclase